MTVLFKVSSEVRKNIAAIVRRVAMGDTLCDMACKIHGEDEWERGLEMDLTACHANGNPMDWETMLEPESILGYMHDVAVIMSDIDRETGTLPAGTELTFPLDEE